MLKILFCASDNFALPALKVLINNNQVEVVGVVTQPDRKAGRKQEIQSSAVGQFFHDQIEGKFPTPLFQPEKLRVAAAEILGTTKPDLIIVTAYGKMIPQVMLEQPQYGCLNIHGSLLPSYRGAVPIEMAILNGEKMLGVSLIKMTAGLDEGDVILEQPLTVDDSDDASSLRAKLAQSGAELLNKLLAELIVGEKNLLEQAQSQTSLAEKFQRNLSVCSKADLTREKMQIYTSDSSELALRKIKAFSAAGGAWLKLQLNEQTISELKILSAEKFELDENIAWPNSSIQRSPKKELILILNGEKLKLNKIQLAGKRLGVANDYLFLANTKVQD